MVKGSYSTMHVSEAYLGKLLQELSRHNIISSIRGPKGDFFLTDEEQKQFILDIVRIIDGEKRINFYVLGISQRNISSPCMLHEMVGPSKSNILKILTSITNYDLFHYIKKADVFFYY